MQYLKKSSRAAAILMFGFWITLITGCANLGAIQDFGKLSADAASYNKLTSEFATSPTRGKSYTFASQQDVRNDLDARAAERKGIVKAAGLFQTTLSEYMTAVADLAGDEAASFDAEIGAFADAALAQKYIKENEAKAVKAIGSIVASAATDFYRQRKLKEVIGQADEPLQVVVTAMVDLVSKTFVASYEVDQVRARNYYRDLEQRARHDDKQTAAAERIYWEGAQKQIEIGESISAARDYAKTLKNIGAAHHQLYLERENVANEEAQRQLKQYIKKIWAGYKATRKEASSGDDQAATAN